MFIKSNRVIVFLPLRIHLKCSSDANAAACAPHVTRLAYMYITVGILCQYFQDFETNTRTDIITDIHCFSPKTRSIYK